MFDPTKLLTVVLATTVLAAPSEVVPRSTTVTCSVKQKDTKLPVKYTFDLDAAKKIAKTAPAGTTNQDKSKGATGSGYPHTFMNSDRLLWPTTECRFDSTTKATKVETLEFPIYDGKDITHMYPWTLNKKKTEVPPCRVVYARVGGAFCGVMCHKSEDDEKEKGFNMCQ